MIKGIQYAKRIKRLDYSYIGPFTEGLAAVSKGTENTGYIDTNGEIAIPLSFVNSFHFSNGLAYALPTNHEHVYINHHGAPVIRNKDFLDCSEFSEGLAAVKLKIAPTDEDNGAIDQEGPPGMWGYIDKSGQIAIPPVFNFARKFHEGLAAIKQDGTWKFIDKQQNVHAQNFKQCGAFSNGLAPVTSGNLWGFIDHTGKLSIPAQYQLAKDFSDGLAAVKAGTAYGFINPAGNMVIKPTSFPWRSLKTDFAQCRQKTKVQS